MDKSILILEKKWDLEIGEEYQEYLPFGACDSDLCDCFLQYILPEQQTMKRLPYSEALRVKAASKITTEYAI